MENQEYLMQLSFLQQEAEKIEEQNKVILQQIHDLKNLQENLSDLEQNHDKEILAPMGKGIFFKTQIKEKELFVNVGSNIVLRKSPKDTIEIIDRQILKLEDLRLDLNREMNKLHEIVRGIIENAKSEHDNDRE